MFLMVSLLFSSWPLHLDDGYGKYIKKERDSFSFTCRLDNLLRI